MRAVLIIPGLGDHTAYIERATRYWPKKYGLQATVHAFPWAGPVDAYEERYGRLLEMVKKLSQTGSIAVIGISAGGSAALNVAGDLPDSVSCVINICGRVREGQQGVWGFRSFPLHWRSVAAVDFDKFDTSKVLTLRPLYDESVPTENVSIEGARNQRVCIVGHVPAIFWCLYLKRRTIARFIHRAVQ